MSRIEEHNFVDKEVPPVLRKMKVEVFSHDILKNIEPILITTQFYIKMY